MFFYLYAVVDSIADEHQFLPSYTPLFPTSSLIKAFTMLFWISIDYAY